MLEDLLPELAKAAATGALAGGASVLVQWVINRVRRLRAGDPGDRATRLERRLAAILVADVVGYSRLMSSDEEGTHRRLIACRREIIEPQIHKHRGRIVKNTGDGALIEFGSIVDAVRCAVEVQRRMLARNAEVPQSRRIEWRMGVNLGDVIVAPDDIYGHGSTLRRGSKASLLLAASASQQRLGAMYGVRLRRNLSIWASNRSRISPNRRMSLPWPWRE